MAGYSVFKRRRLKTDLKAGSLITITCIHVAQFSVLHQRNAMLLIIWIMSDFYTKSRK